MTHTGWTAIGKIARKRRERLGLNQDELALYGGPKVATVGKFERAGQESFPLRTQHQIENALGWSRGTVEQVVGSLNEGRLKVEDWEHDLVEEDIPDLSQPGPRTEQTAVQDEFTRRIDSVAGVLRLVPEPWQDDAVRDAVRAILNHLDTAGAETLGRTMRKMVLLSEGSDTNETSVKAAHEDDVPIERGQGHDDIP